MLVRPVAAPPRCSIKTNPITGTSAPINVNFNAATVGVFEKTVTVTYNDTLTMDLVIKGEVVVHKIGKSQTTEEQKE